MSTVFEFKLQTPEVKTVDLSQTTAEVKQSYEAAKSKFDEEFAKMKNWIQTSNTWEEVKSYFDGFPLSADAGHLTLIVGTTKMEAKSAEEYQSWAQALKASIEKINQEMANSEELKKLEADRQQVQNDTQTNLNQTKQDVQNNTNNTGNQTPEKPEIKYITFENLTLLQAAYANHPEYAEQHEQTREERKFERQTDRFTNANSDRARRRISKRIAKTADQIADRRSATAINMANATADYSLGEELQHQAWYYNDILNALTKDPRSTRVHYFNDHITIDTYHPLFTNPGNLMGTIELTGALAQQYLIERNMREDFGDAMDPAHIQTWVATHPEERGVENHGGLIGSLFDNMVKYTNMPQGTANSLKSVAKIGALIGLGVLGWKAIKKIFNIGGKNKKGEGLAWGLGAAAVLVGLPAITGQSIDKLLFSGDGKAAWDKTKGLFSKMGIELGEMFSSANEKVLQPAFGNLIYGDMTLDEMSKYVEYKDGKYVMKVKEYTDYMTDKASRETDPAEKQKCLDKIALVNTAVREKTINNITNSYIIVINPATVPDKTKTGNEIYSAYISGLTLGADLMNGDKKLKIADQKKLEDYVRDQIVNQHRDPSKITKEELLKAGVLVEIVVAATGNGNTGNTNANNTGNTNTNNTGNTNTQNNNGNNAPTNKPDNADTFSWDKTKEEAKQKAEWIRQQLSGIGGTISTFFKALFDIKPKKEEKDPYAELKKTVAEEKDKLKRLKTELSLYEKLSETKKKEIDIEKEIGELKVIIEEQDNTIKDIEAMMDPNFKDPALDRITGLTDENKRELTLAEKKLNFELKFRTDNDQAHFVEEGGKLYLASCAEKTLIRMENGQYYLDSFMVPFNDAESVVRLANLTNFVKINFANRANTSVDKHWFISDNGDLQFDDHTRWDAVKGGNWRGFGDITVVDGEDGMSSAIKQIGGPVLESRKAEYAQYLNNIKTAGDLNFWVRKADNGMIPEELKNMKDEFDKHVDVIRKGNLYTPQRPDDYPGNETILDQNAKLESVAGYMQLTSHNQKINIIKSKLQTGGYQIGYVNSVDQDNELQGNFLGINFNTPEEAIKMANLINFYKEVYAGYGTSEKSFNISALGGDLEFAEDGVFDWIDRDALPNGVAFNQYAKAFGNARSMSILCDWLNAMNIWEAK